MDKNPEIDPTETRQESFPHIYPPDNKDVSMRDCVIDVGNK